MGQQQYVVHKVHKQHRISLYGLWSSQKKKRKNIEYISPIYLGFLVIFQHITLDVKCKPLELNISLWHRRTYPLKQQTKPHKHTKTLAASVSYWCITKCQLWIWIVCTHRAHIAHTSRTQTNYSCTRKLVSNFKPTKTNAHFLCPARASSQQNNMRPIRGPLVWLSLC